MMKDTGSVTEFVRSAGQTLGLELSEERVEAVATFVAVAQEMSDLLDAAPVPPQSLNLAPVFDPDADKDR